MIAVMEKVIITYAYTIIHSIDHNNRKYLRIVKRLDIKVDCYHKHIIYIAHIILN